MDINELIKLLDYNTSKFYLTGSAINEYPGYAHIFRSAVKDCALQGVYILGGDDNEPIIPIVYVCEAKNEEDATIIHKRVWNQNVVPFLLISTPNTFRLYPGFKYNVQRESSESQAILRITKTANEVLEKLSDFKADRIDIGHVWKKWAKEVPVESRVDRRLLNSLKILGDQLIHNDLPRYTAHRLIGKYVYLHYLRDRDILSDRKFEQWEINPDSVFGHNATLEGFFNLIHHLDNWLNGVVFPISEFEKEQIQREHLQKVASTFAGDDPATGQMRLFKTYEFKHIPTETLSVVYQQFLHHENRERSKGAYYTPVHLVNLIIDELDGKKNLQKGMNIFDPACGSGAFLVQCYRLLIERELYQKSETRLRPAELQKLLTDHIYGIDVDEDACGIAELSLTLTLLDYVDPPDLENASHKGFKLPALRNRNIFHCDKGFFDPNADFKRLKPKEGFDWIIGNPPWKRLSDKNNDAGDKAALDWIENKKDHFPIGDRQVAEAFAWGVTEYISKQGLIGLVMPATTLLKAKGEIFRKFFFSRTDAWCVVNFSNLRHILFEGAVNPSAIFFYTLPGKGKTISSRIVSYAPFAVNQSLHSVADRQQRSKLWTITINSGELREVPRKDAVSGNGAIWKIVMWGSSRDKYLLNSINNSFPRFKEYAEKHGFHAHEGPQLRLGSDKEKVEWVPELIGKSIIDMSQLVGSGKFFSTPFHALKKIDEKYAYVRKGRAIKTIMICRPPHIIVDAARRFAVFANDFITVPPRQIGIVGEPSQINLLKALTLYLNSDFVQYQQFMTSSLWGIERDRPNKKDLENLPIPLDSLEEHELKRWASLHDDIVKTEGKRDVFEKLLSELNEIVYALLKISRSERWLIEDLIRVRMKLNEGSIAQEAVQAANSTAIRTYAEILKEELDSFLDSKIRDQHQISVKFSDQLAVVRIDHPESFPVAPVSVIKVNNAEIENEFQRLKKNLSHRQGQWIYFDRNFKYYEGRTTYFFKPIQRLHWLKSQALFDADEFIAEKLN